MFTMFENFVTADTRSIEILLFTGSSNNNEKRIFYFGEQQKEGLSGMDVKSIVDEEVQRKLREKEFDELKYENKNLKQHIADLESEVDELEKQNARLEMKQSPLNSLLGDVGSSLVESFVKRNPKLMAAFPGGEALAGLLQTSNAEVNEEQTPESEVSFKPKVTTSAPTPSEEDEAAVQFVNQLKSQFSKEEFECVLHILQMLADDKSKIELILNHVNNLSTAA
jgi:FtsZ-binding cell division protein ZapB